MNPVSPTAQRILNPWTPSPLNPKPHALEPGSPKPESLKLALKPYNTLIASLTVINLKEQNIPKGPTTLLHVF